MSFTTVAYLLFLPLTAFMYYIVPKRLQNAVLFIASLFFYWVNLPAGNILGKNIMPLCVIFLSVIFVYFIAQKLEQTQKRKLLLIIAVCSLVGVLAVFKYFNALIPVLFAPASLASLAFPLGISFYTFRALSYLIDVYRSDIKAETNFINFFAFSTFFGSIASGPITRASQVLPQLKQHHGFNVQNCADALRMMLIGFFKQIAVANVLGLSLNNIFENSQNYNGLTIAAAALLYSLQLYFEFSGYSDIAVATGKIFGLDLMQNFKTPYFATNFSGFWARWHISLSSWLQDYIFMPLVWGRWTSRLPLIGKHVKNPPMILSVAIVFFVSGLWHGNTWSFVIWGLLMGIYRVGEELLHKYYKKPKKKPSLSLRIFKTASVFVLWSAGLVFFRMGAVANGAEKALSIFANMFTSSQTGVMAQLSAAIQAGFYPKPVMVMVYVVFTTFVIVLALALDWYQCFKLRDKHISIAFTKLPFFWRWLSYYAFIGIIVLGFIMQSGGFGGTISTPYAGF